MTLKDKTRKIQVIVGAKNAGIYGDETADAILEALTGKAPAPQPKPTPSPTQTKPKTTVCIDPGHGMGNRKPGVFDPGCERGDLHEADIALVWAGELAHQLEKLGARVVHTRKDNSTPCPLNSRATMAENAGAETLISIHVNDAATPNANGTETLHTNDEQLAQRCQDAMLKGLGLKDRGVNQRGDLAVLKFRGRAVLLELGFIGSKTDVWAIVDVDKIKKTCALLAAAILQ
jgi:N-acetylmuramoyl-L-alanine amidase